MICVRLGHRKDGSSALKNDTWLFWYSHLPPNVTESLQRFTRKMDNLLEFGTCWLFNSGPVLLLRWKFSPSGVYRSPVSCTNICHWAWRWQYLEWYGNVLENLIFILSHSMPRLPMFSLSTLPLFLQLLWMFYFLFFTIWQLYIYWEH